MMLYSIDATKSYNWVFRAYDAEDNIISACVIENHQHFWANVEAEALFEKIPFASSYEITEHFGSVDTAPIPLEYKSPKLAEYLKERYKEIGPLINSGRYINLKELRKEPVKRALPKVGRNDPCNCGSGIKYKKCCGKD